MQWLQKEVTGGDINWLEEQVGITHIWGGRHEEGHNQIVEKRALEGTEFLLPHVLPCEAGPLLFNYSNSPS